MFDITRLQNQHMHQVNFLLMALKTSEKVPRIRLGFKPDEL